MASGKLKKSRSGKSGKSGWKKWRENQNIKTKEANSSTTNATPSNHLTAAESRQLVVVEVGQQTDPEKSQGLPIEVRSLDSISSQSSFLEVGTQTDFSFLLSAPRQGQYFKHLQQIILYKHSLLIFATP